jgi:hypothetical protein
MTQKLDVGNVFERIFAVYRDQFTLLIPAALVVFVPIALIDAAISSGGNVLLALVGLAVGFVGTYWYQGMVVEAVKDIMDGRRDHTVGSLLSSVAPVIMTLVAAGILAGLGVLLGLIVFIVPGLFLLTIWALIAPVIVVERAGVAEAFGRSRALVKGHGWQVFAVIVVLFLLAAVLTGVTQAIFVAISDSIIGYGLASLITNVLVAPLSALAASVMYFELKRLRGEGAEAAPPAAPAAPATPAPDVPPTA